MVMRHLIILLALLCASCGSSVPTIKPFKMDIQQGNVVTSKMMLQLKPGMTKSQVRFIMGTPLIQDPFHKDRWDYFYQMRKGGRVIEERRVIVEFENEALVRIRGDVVPAGTAAQVDDPAPVTSSGKKAEKKKGLLERMMFWRDEDEEADKPQAAPEALTAPAPAVESGKLSEQPVAEPSKPAEAPAPVQPAEPGPAPVEQPATTAPQQVEPAEPAPADPAAKPEAETKTEASAAPQPSADDDLPPEDDPGYFERMLEKIGF